MEWVLDQIATVREDLVEALRERDENAAHLLARPGVAAVVDRAVVAFLAMSKAIAPRHGENARSMMDHVVEIGSASPTQDQLVWELIHTRWEEAKYLLAIFENEALPRAERRSVAPALRARGLLR